MLCVKFLRSLKPQNDISINVFVSLSYMGGSVLLLGIKYCRDMIYKYLEIERSGV
jgi:hypothetical protein